MKMRVVVLDRRNKWKLSVMQLTRVTSVTWGIQAKTLHGVDDWVAEVRLGSGLTEL